MKTILIVDDEHAIVETLKEILTWEGYTVVSAADGRAGYQALRDNTPDLLLVDFMMPAMDGVTLLRKVQGDPQLAHVRTVLMTAAPFALDEVAPVWNAILVKPFPVTELMRTIRSLLGGA